MTPPSAPGADLLAALKPIHLPAEPGWWPPAPGWWLLALGLILALIAALALWRRWQRNRAPRLQAQYELELIRQESDSVRQATAITPAVTGRKTANRTIMMMSMSTPNSSSILVLALD